MTHIISDADADAADIHTQRQTGHALSCDCTECCLVRTEAIRATEECIRRAISALIAWGSEYPEFPWIDDFERALRRALDDDARALYAVKPVINRVCDESGKLKLPDRDILAIVMTWVCDQ